MSEKQLEVLFRAKQNIRDINFSQKGFKLLPQLNQRIGGEVIPLNPVAEMTANGWRNLIKLYEICTPAQKNEFIQSIKSLVISDNSSINMLRTAYVKSIFSSYYAMYLEFLGTAYYAGGDIKNAFVTFDEMCKKYPSEKAYLYVARCLMQIGETGDVVELLLNGCAAYPKSALLLLSLGNAYYRNDDTGNANNAIQKIQKEDLIKIQNNAHNLHNLKEEIAEALNNRAIVRPIEKLGFQAYTEDGIRYYWEKLFFHFVGKTRFQHGWSDLCYVTEDRIGSYIKKYPDIKSVLNFGVFCAVPDYNLAVKHPEISFLGVDREKSTKELNDRAFKSDNISFHALDMLDIIYEEKTEVKDFVLRLTGEKSELMIFHARTATLIYPEALKRFYKSCARLGVKYIALYENMCLSRSEMKYFDFDDFPEDSIPYFSIMMIHNYKKFLEEAGYEIVEKEVWNYSQLLWEGKDLYNAESWYCIGDGHVALLARLK